MVSATAILLLYTSSSIRSGYLVFWLCVFGGAEGGDSSASSCLFSHPELAHVDNWFRINKAWLAHGPTQLNRESLEHCYCIMKESKPLHNEVLSLGKTHEW
ncbi:hypothetical protein TRIATDRAFT_85381 [Trichoderma atroviride IMI 206040]|uniref:Secreted protein n=1 Tax=Hypocrea atroviridis (strain ATCC 20476 / IMI 206040) TaxID=452589 RepID=G9P7G3_HYPAI|nr:uncharacterized protein TRIATDRAFT_85381 [Trichoderma atroviride IMI 206040]EHK40778.1 hypothetical protein TRIATDRAFT_85381 [Trichoderma atroviride IMI 206040]